ncbi:MAG: uncharacterized protein A8A55_2813 [Amphiamblys sp. WSBS2006]|nr:MAG: uncharacterized protein A8A55_2813 [Amphiamblys sp. WSBS2006]
MSGERQSQTISGGGDSQAVWRTIRAEPTADPRCRGNLQVTPEAIAHVWECHYREMFRDKTGHSRDRSYWEDKPVRVRQPGAGAEYLDRELQESVGSSGDEELEGGWTGQSNPGVVESCCA